MHVLPTFRRLLVAVAATVAVLGTTVVTSAPVQAEPAGASVRQSGFPVANESQGAGLDVRFVFARGSVTAWIPGRQYLVVTPQPDVQQAVQVHIQRHSTGAKRHVGNFTYAPGAIVEVQVRGTWDAPRCTVVRNGGSTSCIGL